MSYPATVFRVMIASPSDVLEERKIAREIIIGWNSIHSEKSQIVLLPLGWEFDSYPKMGDKPQNILNNELLVNCDLLVGIFWTRIGTQTDEFPSGTVEEIERHIEADKPVMIYFSDTKVNPSEIDQKQYGKLKKFKASCIDRGLYKPYETIEDFKEKFFSHLQMMIVKEPYFENYLPADVDLDDIYELYDLERKIELSKEAKTLLINAGNSHDGQFMRIKNLGMQYLIQVDGKRLNADNKPRTAAKWDGAVDNLVSKGFAEDVGYKGEIFRITDSGFYYLEQEGLFEE